MQQLKKNVGKIPTAPKEQNAVWYRLLKAVESEESVFQAHHHYLLFRDLAFISLLLVPVVPAVLFLSGLKIQPVAIIAALFLVQFFGSAIAARNHGTRLVTNVLAVSASKKM